MSKRQHPGVSGTADMPQLTATEEHKGRLAMVRRLHPVELEQLRKDMAESSAWAKAELKRRRAAKNQKKSGHGIDNGIDNERFPK
ncbi:hypothetical protein [Thalassospira profundimaris]|uniref:hypothetical protein n=1 Tax=Thalassospira profundimaris TaxID=502049 RepID=UPI000DED5816|nr:hypothetical protein [Thalassospira profundimaris]